MLFLLCTCTLVVLVTSWTQFFTGHITGCIFLGSTYLLWDCTSLKLESSFWVTCIWCLFIGLDWILFVYIAGCFNYMALLGFSGLINWGDWQFLSSPHIGFSGIFVFKHFVAFLKHLVDWWFLTLNKLGFVSVAGSLDCTSLFFITGFTGCLSEHWVDGHFLPSHTDCLVSWHCLP